MSDMPGREPGCSPGLYGKRSQKKKENKREKEGVVTLSDPADGQTQTSSNNNIGQNSVT